MGRVGVITHRERHDGGFNIVHIKDAIDNSFATRETNVFVIGNDKPWISLPKGKGVKVDTRHHLAISRLLILSSSQSPKKEIVVVHMPLQVIECGGPVWVLSTMSMKQVGAENFECLGVNLQDYLNDMHALAHIPVRLVIILQSVTHVFSRLEFLSRSV